MISLEDTLAKVDQIENSAAMKQPLEITFQCCLFDLLEIASYKGMIQKDSPYPAQRENCRLAAETVLLIMHDITINKPIDPNILQKISEYALGTYNDRLLIINQISNLESISKLPAITGPAAVA